uniref:Uncharacterized protein n=1 Tax=Streptomyces sp. NBC_00093 TaxID=2975649 RepID=A0AAU2A1D2_9ACTN
MLRPRPLGSLDRTAVDGGPAERQRDGRVSGGPEAWVRTLQRSAGNAAVARAIGQARGQQAAVQTAVQTVVQRKWPGPNAADRHHTDDPTAHPEWAMYRTLMTDAGFSANVVENLWSLLVGGLREQETINSASADPSLTRTERRLRREGNDWYQQAIEMLRENSGFTTPRMALWSGGFDVCKYAQSKGYTPMEFTRAGKVFNELEFHRNWGLQGPLWNALSKFYAAQATGPVHIFLRSYSPDSVLIGQEVPQLRQLQRIHPEVELIWHPLYTDEQGRIREVSRDRELVDDAPYATRDTCVAVLYDYLMYRHDEGNGHAARSYQEMQTDLSKNVNPGPSK